MCAYEVAVGIMQGAEPGEINQMMVPVLAKKPDWKPRVLRSGLPI